MNQLLSPTFKFAGNLYPTDILDILIIALFLYSVLYLFKKTRTFLILIGLIIITLLFLTAKAFNLYLTSSALQYFFGVSVIVFIIIFQQEIRKYFEMIGLFGTRRIKAGFLTSKSPSTQEIIQAAVKMAQSKIGALIVLQGKDNLDHLLEGGTDLDAVISEEILQSIFEPHSPGHDGALIISNNRIAKFSTHLPLSNNFKELGKLGTRHSAALGLAENSDCLCLVVSEERGKISICKDGKLKPLSEFSDLEKELDKFIKSRFAPPAKRTFFHLISHNWELKTTALICAAILWFLIAFRTEMLSKTFAIPVTFSQLPQNVLIETYSPKEIAVTVIGRGNLAFTGIDSNDFKIDLDTSSLANGLNNFEITTQLIKQPLNLSIVSIEPQTVMLTAKKHYPASVNIEAQTTGEPPTGYTVSEISVTPNQVDLWIPEDLPVPVTILTESIDLTGQTESFVAQANLVIPPTLKLQKPETSVVNVTVTIGH